jgi:dolichol-phosphate mannosyltransferase|tara:strand:- start:2447 stop:3184 length:738 start_codon:yes stop_codon:yes gene_type:complete
MIYILLPAYNEEEGIERLLERVYRIQKSFEFDLRLIVVNDGSHDNTQMVIESFKEYLDLEIINFETNMGIENVFYEGFKRVNELSDNKEDICITMDSDNTHNPYYLVSIIYKLKGPCDIVIASRFLKGGGMQGVPFYRKILSDVASYFMRKFVGIPNITDYSTFYRGFKVYTIKEALKKYDRDLIKGEGFSCMINMLIKLNQMGYKFDEIPFTLKYYLKEGSSGIQIFKTIRGYLKIIYRHLQAA